MTARSHPIEEAGGWIEWSGGECPVDPRTVIETQMRHETPQCYDPDRCEAGSYMWSHDGGAWDIVAYRVVSE